MTRQARGFTMIEAMITLVILAVIVGLALPSYNAYIIRGNRAEGIESLLAAAACQERLFIRNNAFDANSCGNTSTNGHYVVTIATSNSNQNFVASAAPQSSQAKDGCGTLTLSDRGVRTANGQQGEYARNCWSGKYQSAGS